MQAFYVTLGLSLMLLSCSDTVSNDSTTSTRPSPPTTISQIETTTTVMEIVIPSELDFIALTTKGEIVKGGDLWLNDYKQGNNLSKSETGLGQDVLFWFWAPN